MLAQRMDTSGNQWNIFEAPFGQPNPYAIRVGQDTLINGVEYHKLLRSINGEEPSSDWSLQLDSMKVESLVIAYQP